ncbi:DUF1934 domain-containing protein [Allobacillus sp. SKP2-8]|nr:DUF1934 domain-containing protein [Allobacillus sp. SKP2-8]
MDMADPIRVDIEVNTEIIDENGEETIQKQEKGVYSHKNDLHVIKYDEQMDDFGKVKTTLIIQQEKIVLKREGTLKLHQIFRIGNKTEALYTHPYGSFRLETSTHRMEFYKGMNKRSGRVFIDYDVVINDQEPRRHTLQVKFQEED